MNFIIHTDGGARGNPGPAAVGISVERVEDAGQTGKEIIGFGKTIGETTNNVAEYTAVLQALQNIKYQISNIKYEEKKNVTIEFYLDSKLVVEQLNGNFKIKDANLQRLAFDVRILEKECGGVVTYSYVPREQNKRADLLVNQALDA